MTCPFCVVARLRKQNQAEEVLLEVMHDSGLLFLPPVFQDALGLYGVVRLSVILMRSKMAVLWMKIEGCTP